MNVDPYDALPYTDDAYAESHPDRLAVVAKLSGWAPPRIEEARVLEIGCARGGNLLPMAESLPRATLVGVDRSRRQVEEAQRIARETRLSNVTFHASSFEDVDLGVGSFDFVLCHGVYSWVPIETRQALLGRIARWLTKGGVAYVSFNVLPGWYGRSAARDWLRFARELGEPLELRWLRERVSPELDTYRRELERVEERIASAGPEYLVHEYLAVDNHPVHVDAFLREAEGAGLSYLGDAIPAATALELLDEEARARAASLSVAAAQQLVDFVRCTPFRHALLVRADGAAERGWRWPSLLDPRAQGGLRVASRLASGNPNVQLSDPATRMVLGELSRVAPLSVALEELSLEVRSELFDLWLAIDGLDLHVYEPSMVTTISERPRASAVARWHAANGGALTNLWHQKVVVPEEIARFILSKLDGERTVDALVQEAKQVAASVSEGELRALVQASLELAAGAALLVG